MGATESLLRSSRKGNLQEVERALSEGATVNRGDYDGVTSLAWASKGGFLDIVERLLVAGADPNLVDNNGTPPLLLAVSHSHPRIVERLLHARASVDTATTNGTTPLGAAAQLDLLEITERLLSAGARPDLVSANGWTPLALAAYGGHAAVAQSLIAARANVDRATEQGVPPLFIAAEYGHLAVVEKLLHAGATIDIANADGFTPLHIAVTKSHAAIVTALLGAGANANFVQSSGFMPLQEAAQSGDLAVVESLLAAGAQVNSFNNNTSPALYVASLHGHAGVVERLLAAGADANLADSGGNTPLIGAACNGHAAVIEKLAAAGAVLDTANAVGSALTYAAMGGHSNVARVLLEAGADPMSRHSNGLTASEIFETHGNVTMATLLRNFQPSAATYFRAVVRGNMGVVKRLVRAGASYRGQHNRTPLHFAAELGKFEAVRVLVEGGAALSARDDAGWTPLHFCCAKGDVESVLFVVDHGAVTSVVDDLGRTPVDVAAMHGHVEAVKALAGLGASLQCVGADGRTILHRAVWGRSAALLEYLLSQCVVNVNAGDAHGHSPLHHAVHALANIDITSSPPDDAEVNDRLAILRVLLSTGRVNANAQDSEGKTPLFVGCQRGDFRSVRVLLDAGARTDIADNSGHTPLAVAVSSDIRTVVDLFHNSQQFHERCFSLLNIDDATPVEATQLLALVPLITSVHDLRLMLTVCTIHADAARTGNALKAALNHVVTSKLTFDDQACVDFKFMLKHCKRAQLISRDDVMLLDRRAEKVNTASADWVIELKRHVHTNSWRLDAHERHMASITESVHRVHSLVMENRANITQVASHLANLQQAYVTRLEQEEKARRIRLVCGVVASVGGFVFAGALENVAGKVFDLANPGEVAAKILKNENLVEFLKDTTKDHIKDFLHDKLVEFAIPQDKFEDLVRIGLVLTHPELIHENPSPAALDRQQNGDVESRMQRLQLSPQPNTIRHIPVDSSRSEFDDVSSVSSGDVQLADPGAFPYHAAVQQSLGNADAFKELTQLLSGHVDANAVAPLRLTEMTSTQEELCAAQYAYLLGYTAVGDMVSSRMSNPPAFDTAPASSVELQSSIDDYPFVLAVAESGGKVGEYDHFVEALDTEEHTIEEAIPARVVRGSSREVAWTVVELACHLGYGDVLKALFKDVCRSVPSTTRVLLMKRALERAKQLSDRSLMNPPRTT